MGWRVRKGAAAPIIWEILGSTNRQRAGCGHGFGLYQGNLEPTRFSWQVLEWADFMRYVACFHLGQSVYLCILLALVFYYTVSPVWFVFAAPEGSSNYSPDCKDEQKAVGALGFNETTWDNDSGEEPQPGTFFKHWTELTDKERAAAMVLGYTKPIWNQPASIYKYWKELTSCGMWCAFV